MNFLIALVLVIFFCVYFQNALKTSTVFFYIIAAMISGTEIVAKLFSLPDFVGDLFYPMFANGIISMALFTVVMYSSAVKDGSKFQRLVYPIRGELSIIASILAIGHNFSVGITSLDLLKTWAGMTSKFSGLIIFLSFLSIFIMILLLTSSFKMVKQKIDKKVWLKIQKLSYVLYTLINVQILFVSIPLAFENQSHYVINSIVYTTSFVVYATLRLTKAFKQTSKTYYIYILALAYTLVAGIIFLSWKFHIPIDPNVTIGSSARPNTTQTETVEEPEQEPVIQGEVVEYDLDEDEVTEDELDYEEVQDEVSDEEVVELLKGDFARYEDGTYTGYGQGEAGLITISITIENRQLTDVEIIAHSDTPSRIIGTFELMDSMVETQSLDVDVITGATYSSNGVIDAVRDALTTAKIILE